MFNKRSYFEHFSEATEVHRHYALSRADEIKGYYKIWVGERYIGIELGPIAPMIENYRSGLLWRFFMQSPEAKRAVERLKAQAKTREFFR